jgi:hypothetical protein
MVETHELSSVCAAASLMGRNSKELDELPASASGSGAAKAMDAQPAEIRKRMGAYLICTDISVQTS